MGPSRERFERSIPDQEERMKELLDNFTTKMLGKFQEQEQRIAELEENIAEQQKTIDEQNETIQRIAKLLGKFGHFMLAKLSSILTISILIELPQIHRATFKLTSTS